MNRMKEIARLLRRSLPDDDIVIIFGKITKEKDKRKRNVKIRKKKNVICNHFNSGFMQVSTYLSPFYFGNLCV